MLLCSVCDAISFADLPPFPEEQHGNILTGLNHVHPLRREREFARDPTASSVRHHNKIEHLQGAAAAGCALCALIWDQLQLLFSEIEGLDKETQKIYELSYRPTGDLWLARRPYGGQGFWVLSESIGSTDEREIIPIAAFSFAVAEDNPLTDSIYARPVQQSPETYALQQLLEWDTQCKQHRGCYPASRAVPRCLVDVGRSKSEEESVELVQLGAGEAQYTALSYTSDYSREVQWRRPDNSDAERKIILTTDLPKMFRDAILVTRTLGVRYIWIDSLCIPGNAPDWERDSEEIGSVYENAYLTLSATGAKKVADGLLFSRPSRTSIQVLYRSSDGSVDGMVSVSILPLSKEVLRSYIEMQGEPVSKDIWSFQERVLSRRVVHFASDQIYFECLGHFRSEDGLIQDRWHSLSRAYGKLEPTTPSEKLRALSNIARAFQNLLGGEYVAGLWKESLIESLCWRSMNCKPLCGSTAPSWSWARVNGIAVAGFGCRSVCSEATISSTQVILENDSKPFGNVSSASIVIAAPVVPLKLVEKGGKGRHIFLRTEDGHEDGFYAGFDFIDGQHEVSAEGIRSSKLFALVLIDESLWPILEHATSVASGLATIRAFNRTHFYVERMHGLVDRSAKLGLHLILGQRWLAVRLGSLGAVFVTPVATTLVYQGEDAAKTGFIITLALQLKAALGGTTTMFILHDMLARTIGRIVSLAKARIEVCDLAVRYDASAQPALREVNFSIDSRQRLGIVGRTGSGKTTTLTNAILRFIAVAQGQIIIDGVDVSTLELNRLQKAITLIPQDPFLFSGILRSNVDPSGTNSDSLVLEVLRRVRLIPTAATNDVGNYTSEFFHVDMEIQPGGVNLSILVMRDGKVAEIRPPRALMAKRGLFWDPVQQSGDCERVMQAMRKD
ncbi:hypothetical protein MY4824_003160 [Beauveria thailandica]